MYIIKADGKLLYSPELISEEYKVISPRMHLEINAAGSLDFTLPPCNALYDEVLKMKSIITVEQDGEVVFRGRITEETVDTYQQRRIYCEGDLSFLLDSLQAPANFSGTQYDLFSQLIAAHNAQMDADKQFTLGDVSGLDREETFSFSTTSYFDTLSVVQNYLIDLFGGYIQTRTEGDVHYIDYVDDFTDECSQVIEFGVNMLNFESQINTTELCSVLVPLGATQDDGTALTIASVNGGKVYIENTEAVEHFGRVYRTYTWENVTDPAELLELGMEYMQGAGIPETLMITALDMHLLDADVEKIRKGCMVRLKSKPHGIDKKIVCASIDADLENADQTVFGLGLPKQRLKTIAEQTAETEAGLDGAISDIEETWTEIEDFIWPEIEDTWTEIEDFIWPEIEGTNTEVQRVSSKVEDQHKWLTETDTSLNIAIENLDLIGHRVNQVEVDVDAAEAAITLKANQTSVDVLEERMSGAEIRIDGAEAEITLKAAQSVVDELGQRMTGAEIRIDGAEAEITLKAAQSVVDEMGERLSTAEIRIDGAESEIALKADTILLDGYVKTGDLEAETLTIIDGYMSARGDVDLGNVVADSVNTSWVSADSIGADSISVGSLTVGGTSFVPADYATEAWVESQGYLKETPEIDGVTEAELDARLEMFATRDWVTGTATAGLATEAWVTENFSKASATYKPTAIERYGDVSGTSIPVQALNESGEVLLTGTVDAGDVYTSGKNSVTLSKSWSGGILTVKASNGKTSTAQLSKGTESWSGNTVKVPVMDGGGSTGYTISVNASSVYNSGYSAGNSAGYNSGYSAGNSAGYDSGYSAGNRAGFNSGYDSGYTAGQASIDTGAYYDEGYSAGVASVDTTSYYNSGWNACRDACSLVTVYTISENSPGTLYVKVGDYYSSVGSSWVKVSRKYGVYTIPSAK